MTLPNYYFISGSRAILCCICIFFLGKSFGQVNYKTVVSKAEIEVYTNSSKNLYTSRANLITIISNDTNAKYSLHSSQGIVWQTENAMFYVDSLEAGKTVISIFQATGNKKIKVFQKDYSVITSTELIIYNNLPISPNISLGGFTKNKVQLDTLKNITSLSIDDNYEIIEATFYIGVTDISINVVKSKYFYDCLKEIWKRIPVNGIIVVDNIVFVDKKGKRYVYPYTLSIVTTN